METELSSTFKEIEEDFGSTFDEWVSVEARRYYQLEDHIKVSIAKFGHVTTSHNKYPQNLTEEIANRIIESNIFVAIAGFYSYYKQWLQYELKIASDYRKPVITLLPFEQKDIPKEILNLNLEVLNWNKESIVNAILAKLNLTDNCSKENL